MNYCPECGSPLTKKIDGIDGYIDYCPKCQKFIYPPFNSAISTLAIKEDKVLLIKQYGRDDYILVAGYITKGEDAKQTLIREVKEEVNLDVNDYLYNDNFYYERSNTLIHNYISFVDGEIKLTDEVDEATFFDFHEAYLKIKPSSLAKKFFFLGMLKLNRLEDLIIKEKDGFKLYDDHEQLIVHYSQFVHFIADNYKYLQVNIQQLYEKCYNKMGDRK